MDNPRAYRRLYRQWKRTRQAQGQLNKFSEQSPPYANMAAEFTVHSLGVSMLTKGTTGLGVIQKPLKEKYFAYLKTGDTKSPPGPEVGVRIEPRGITLLYAGSHPGQRNEDFYDISSIHFMEAIHFVISKKSDKKLFYAFLPIDESSASNATKDALFNQLEKKQHSFTKLVHPPILVCVMRRPTGVKAVDCHMFVVPYIDDALEMAGLVRRFQEYPAPAGNYGPPPPMSPGRLDKYPNPDVVPREPLTSPENTDYEIYRGGGVELRQEHFRQNPDHNLRNSRNSGGYYDPNRSFEKDRHSETYFPYDDRDRRPEMRPWVSEEPQVNLRKSGNYDRGRDVYPDRKSMEYRDVSGYKERDSHGREYTFDNAVSHERQRSGELKSYGQDRGTYGSGSGSDRSSGRNQYPGNYDDRNSGHLPPGSRYSGEMRDRPLSPGRYGDQPPPRHSYPEPQYNPNRPYPASPPRSPRGRSPPHSPRGRMSPPDDNIYSASNLESRQDEDNSGKPVAKVPPHRHAGIKVLPSLPLAGINKVQLKPVSPRSPKSSPDVADKPPKYNLDADSESEEENPYDNAPVILRKDRGQSDKTGGERKVEGNGYHYQDRRPFSDSYYGANQGPPNDQHYRLSGAPNRQGSNKLSSSQGTKPWSYNEEKEKFLREREENDRMADYSHSSSREYADRHGSGSSHSGDGFRKDAEIADMFSNLRTGRGSGEDTDFERSLGYLP